VSLCKAKAQHPTELHCGSAALVTQASACLCVPRVIALPVYPCMLAAHLRRLSWQEVSWVGTLAVGPTIRMHRPVRIMQVGTAPIRTLRVTTTSSACSQAPALYPANLEKCHPMHPVRAVEPGSLGAGVIHTQPRVS
jgi:hypothetical protein